AHGQLLALVAHRWALRVPECPYVFHRSGRAIRDFQATWIAACTAVGVVRAPLPRSPTQRSTQLPPRGGDRGGDHAYRGAGRRRACSGATTRSTSAISPRKANASPPSSR